MHPNPAFRHETRDRNLSFARARGFGVLSINGPDGPLAALVPFFRTTGQALPNYTRPGRTPSREPSFPRLR
jgi:predicted FMN-binding regulatory protein PaiB